jgi:hypothetical protein
MQRREFIAGVRRGSRSLHGKDQVASGRPALPLQARQNDCMILGGCLPGRGA